MKCFKSANEARILNVQDLSKNCPAVEKKNVSKLQFQFRNSTCSKQRHDVIMQMKLHLHFQSAFFTSLCQQRGVVQMQPKIQILKIPAQMTLNVLRHSIVSCFSPLGHPHSCLLCLNLVLKLGVMPISPAVLRACLPEWVLYKTQSC